MESKHSDGEEDFHKEAEEMYDNVPLPEDVVSLRDGYNQTYVIQSSDSTLHNVLFRCGNWCYDGFVDLGNSDLTLEDVPSIIPALQKQQGSLQFMCEWRNIPTTSRYAEPLEILYDTFDFIGAELGSSKLEKKLVDACEKYPWIEDDDEKHFFELQSSGFDCFEGIDLVASKTFVRGLNLLVIYYQRSFYIVLQEGSSEQPLLDVRFPDLSQHLQGLQLYTYQNRGMKKLHLWQMVGRGAPPSPVKMVRVETKDISGDGYNQTFLIRKASAGKGNNLREILFRFGNWCYNGHVDLGPKLELADIPIIIPMLRRQQSALTFMCESSKLPATSLFANSMEYLLTAYPAIQFELSKAEKKLQKMAKKESKNDECGKVSQWLDDENLEFFFEIGLEPSKELKEVEAIASKVYIGGVVLILLYYESIFYVTVQDASDEQPLLDTFFPDVCRPSKGFQISTYRRGVEGCRDIRRISLWRMVDEIADFKNDLIAKKMGGLSMESSENETKFEEQRRGEIVECKDSANSSTSSSPTKEKIMMPHHIAPLKGGLDPTSRLKALGKNDITSKAPWDSTGRPLGMACKK